MSAKLHDEIRVRGARGLFGRGWLMGCALLAWAGCEFNPPQPTPTPPPEGPVYVGVRACVTCHANLVDDHRLHGHAHALKIIEGQPPEFPGGLPEHGVAAPPPGFAWTDFAYLVGGYQTAANFVDLEGYLVFDAADGDFLQYNTDHPPTGTPAGYEAFEADNLEQAPFGFACLRCHVTGGASFLENGGRRQDSRPGVGATWVQAGVQCEACHGPGGEHVPAPEAGNIAVDGSTAACARCHALGDGDVLLAKDGFVAGFQQATEVRFSPHDFACTVCHDPHVSVYADRERGLRNRCEGCHATQNMALHANTIFAQGDYVEVLGCESCHMPFGTKTALAADDDFTGGIGRIGDTRTHVINVDTSAEGYTAVVSDDGARIRTDLDGQAALTVDFACLRCHNGLGSAPAFTLPAASLIAEGIHQRP